MIMYLSPVTVFSSHVDLRTISFFNAASFSATAPFFFRSATVIPGLPALRASSLGEYQIGEPHARSWMVADTTSGGETPSLWAWIVVQRGVGISSTRA